MPLNFCSFVGFIISPCSSRVLSNTELGMALWVPMATRTIVTNVPVLYYWNGCVLVVVLSDVYKQVLLSSHQLT